MGVVNTTYTFTSTDTITSAKMNNIIDETTFTGDAIQGTTLQVVSPGKLAVSAGGITSNEMAANSVVTAAITDSNVTTAKIADSNVTTAKIADLNVTTAKIADAAITATKIAYSNFPIQIVQAVKTDVQTIAGSASAFSDITGLSVTLTRVNASASGKVRVQANILTTTTDSSHGVMLRIMRDSTPIGLGDASGIRIQATSNTGYNGAFGNESGVIDFIDSSPGSAATVTYKIQAKVYSFATGYINRVNTDTDNSDYVARTISTLTLTELTP
jgi:hypothetical protein